MSEIDWKMLLLKYMAHVGKEEGETFVPRYGSEIVFTKAELEALEAFDKADVSPHLAQTGWMMSADYPDL